MKLQTKIEVILSYFGPQTAKEIHAKVNDIYQDEVVSEVTINCLLIELAVCNELKREDEKYFSIETNK